MLMLDSSLTFPDFLRNLDPNVYLSDNYRVIDFETTNLADGDPLDPRNRVVLWVGFDGRTGLIDSGYFEEGSKNYERLLEFISGADYLVAHYAKFELQHLYKIGVEPGSVLVYDTFLGQWCIDGNRRTDRSLDGIARRYDLGQKESLCSQLIKAGVCPSTISRTRLQSYCLQDVLLTHSIFLKQRLELSSLGLLPVFFTRNLTCMVLADIEKYGMCLDGPAVTERLREELTRYQTLLSEIFQLSGGINPKSSKQKAEFLYDTLKFLELTDTKGQPKRTSPSKRFPEGGRKTDKNTIALLVATTAKQRAFKDLMARFSPVSMMVQNLTKMANCIEKENPPILYASIDQGNTVTHRLASRGKAYKVQFQNIDRRFKRFIRARHDGWRIGDADAPQLEFRAAMHLSGDNVGHEEIRKHFDVHLFTAATLNRKAQSDVTSDERTEAKPQTFKPLYGGMSGTDDEIRYYKAFRKKYRKTYETQTAWTHEVLRTKALRTVSGLTFRWPHVKVYDSGYIKHTSEIFNYPVQSLATAEIIPIALIYLWYMLRGLRSFLINTVHDSVLTEVAPGEEAAWESAVKAAFTVLTFRYLKKVYGIEWTIPLGAEYSLHTNWGQAAKGDKSLYEVDPLENQ